MDRLKNVVKRTPLIRDIARAAMRGIAARRARDFSSADYWESRYIDGRTSGSGSYNRLAQFKADILNRFVEDNRIGSVIEFGSGDGSQLKLADYPHYVGVDVSQTAIAATQRLFSGDSSKQFVHADELGPQNKAELSLSLDVIYHLVEEAVFDQYMARLFDAATRFVIVYSSNCDRASDSVHVRHRRFTGWIETNRPGFKQIGFVENPYPEDIRDLDNTSFADFYLFERAADPSNQ